MRFLKDCLVVSCIELEKKIIVYVKMFNLLLDLHLPAVVQRVLSCNY